MKVTLQGVWINDRKKDGTSYSYQDKKTGQTVIFKRASIKVNDEFFSCNLFNKDIEYKVREWQAGDEVDITLYEENGFKNFKLPSKLDLLEARLDKLENIIYQNETKHTGTTAGQYSPSPSYSTGERGEAQNNVLGDRGGTMSPSDSMEIPPPASRDY